jgi:hypothetical protein
MQFTGFLPRVAVRHPEGESLKSGLAALFINHRYAWEGGFDHLWPVLLGRRNIVRSAGKTTVISLGSWSPHPSVMSTLLSWLSRVSPGAVAAPVRDRC